MINFITRITIWWERIFLYFKQSCFHDFQYASINHKYTWCRFRVATAESTNNYRYFVHVRYKNISFRFK